MDNIFPNTEGFETSSRLSLHLGREVKPRVLHGSYGVLDGLIAGQILAGGTLLSALPSSEKAEYLCKIQKTLDYGTPLLDEVRDIAVARFVGDFYRVMQNSNITYVTPMDSANDVLLVKTRVKSAKGLLRKAREGRTLQDFYGATIVARNWDVVDRKVRPFLEDNFLVVPEMAKFYRNKAETDGLLEARCLSGYHSSRILGKRPNGYESEHLLLFYPTDGRTSVDCMIPIDVHLQSLDAFMTAEWGKASLQRHHAYDLRVGKELRRRMHIPEETYRRVLDTKKLEDNLRLDVVSMQDVINSKSLVEFF